ncbi:hypothetical protein MACH08_15620 [Oceanobacillus kimchii]|uniref:KTSC domain-containing protein n=1 Tax=Oceanobacillus kimchii TaxID=746691 RepID=A0ABQ5TFX4_9BACI|nr:hypothetical protein MACH08_15620 [Oceanobacillus kimchii]
MRHKPIPIYAERKERDTGYTIFLDSSTNKVYRAFHKDYNQTTYCDIRSFKSHFRNLSNAISYTNKVSCCYFYWRIRYRDR